MPRPANSTFNGQLSPKGKKPKELPPERWAIPPDQPIAPPVETRTCTPHWDEARREWAWPPVSAEAKARLRKSLAGNLPNAWANLPRLGEDV